ncbi:MAG: bifunctional [glutamate--ammonia ligase]-adenylyl-L-tyrosine phosphorylase/[glutamate--ammonia-ligase] adenylyltransferase [Thermodesulfobacteriota bacterium]|nr:bifunctional [glutamate--ammonia ligase]-adenylyl-L-tyrosine phosphorylase/[glutamate--ammonia-ligase] adenylyltransferase [Thermodesulfobacteriota bacterium]
MLNKKKSVFNAFSKENLVLPGNTDFLDKLEKALFFSEFIFESIVNHPEIFMDLISSGDLESPCPAGYYADQLTQQIARVSETSEMKKILLKTRMREMVRIAWQDLTGTADLNETLKDLSSLAEACVDKALRFLYGKLCLIQKPPLDPYGKQQEIIVLGMGKLGARELNFSSDIDLIFACPDNTLCKHSEQTITSEEFFTKLCRSFLRVFDTAMDNSALFRVDTRLRPFGTSGPLVMSCSEMENYYQYQGREWERYALIKARPIAGDTARGKALIKALNPFIYRRYFDYGTFDAFRDMKKRITFQARDKRLKNNIKLGKGGIREIEFFCQIFQLVRGGVEPEFQEQNLLKILALLADRACIDPSTKTELRNAYIFLRKAENRLQAHADCQTHDLPQTHEHRLSLALSMGFNTWDEFLITLNLHRERVHTHFNHLLEAENEDQNQNIDEIKYLWAHINDPQAGETRPALAGFKDSGQVISLLKRIEAHTNTKKLTTDGKKRLDKLIPLLVKKAGKTKTPETVLSRFADLIINIERRTCYISLLLENPRAVDTLAVLAEKSHWIISFLASHPALLDELVNPDALYEPPGRDALVKELDLRMRHIPDDDFEFQLEELCLFKQINILRVAAADISRNYPLMKVSDQLTCIAETILNKIIEISWHQTAAKYGSPLGNKAYKASTCGFAAIAYGKLGGIELGYNSDLDLVFIHTGDKGMTEGGSRAVEKKRFYSLLGQRIINTLTIHTPAGTLYQPDMRLRPSGQAGVIVSQVDAFAEYTENQAWTWEHQAIIRARPVAGDEYLKKRFQQIRKKALIADREPESLKQDVVNMRERLRKEHKYARNTFDVKQGSGGVVDIEFLVQFLVLKHSHDHPSLVQWTDNVRLLDTLAAEGLLSQKDSAVLKTAYLELRMFLHRLSFQEHEQEAWENESAEIRKKVTFIYEQISCSCSCS